MWGDEPGSHCLFDRLTGERPIERVRHGLVVVGDELSQSRLEVGNRLEASASETLSMDDAEYDFDLIQPRTVFREVNESYAMARVRQEFPA